MPFNRIRTIGQFIRGCFKIKKQMKIVKFGGKSLANGEGINTVVNIIEGKIKKKKSPIVVSARGKATDELDDTIAAKMEITNHFREF
jgi:aspartokinase